MPKLMNDISQPRAGGGDRVSAEDAWEDGDSRAGEALRRMEESANGEAASVPPALAIHYLKHLRTDFIKPLTRNEMAVLAVGLAISAENRSFVYSDVAALTKALVGTAMVPTTAYDALEGLLSAGAIYKDPNVRRPGSHKSTPGYGVTELGNQLFWLTMAANRKRLSAKPVLTVSSSNRRKAKKALDLLAQPIGNA